VRLCALLFSIFSLLVRRHNDLPWNIRKFVHNHLDDFRFSEDLRKIAPWSSSAWSHTDLLRMKAGYVGAQVSVETTFCCMILLATEKSLRL